VSEMAIVIPYFNPVGYRSHLLKLRHSLGIYRALGLAEHVYLAGAGPRPSIAANVAFWDDTCPYLWHKERLINLAVARLPARYTKVAWMDSDVLVGPEWTAAVAAALRDASVVQCFTRARYRSLDGDPSRTRVGALCHGTNGAVGLAWAACRSLFHDGPGLFDLGLVGGGDSVFALGVLRNTPAPSLPWLPVHRAKLADAWSPTLLDALDGWLDRAAHWHGTASAGSAATEVEVIEHGAVLRRSYNDRHRLLAAVEPQRHLCVVDGVYRWSDEGMQTTEPAIRAYFQARHEDDGLALEPADDAA
jgi:hypothetical protein